MEQVRQLFFGLLRDHSLKLNFEKIRQPLLLTTEIRMFTPNEYFEITDAIDISAGS